MQDERLNATRSAGDIGIARIVLIASAVALGGCWPNPNNPNSLSDLDMAVTASSDTNPADGMTGQTYSVRPGPFGTTRVYDGTSRWIGTYTPRELSRR